MHTLEPLIDHLDMKPENMLVRDNNTCHFLHIYIQVDDHSTVHVFLADFGLRRLWCSERQQQQQLLEHQAFKSQKS